MPRLERTRILSKPYFCVIFLFTRECHVGLSIRSPNFNAFGICLVMHLVATLVANGSIAGKFREMVRNVSISDLKSVLVIFVS